MNSLLKIFFFLFTVNCYSQNDTTVLIVPMKNAFIEFDNYVVKMLDYNNLQMDSVKNKIQHLSIDRLSGQFPKFSFLNLHNTEYKYLVDSLDVLCQWNSFQIKKINNSSGLDKVILTNDERLQCKYYGRVTDMNENLVFKALIQKYNLQYIFLINKFETITKRPFSSKTYFCIHFEIYDKNFNKIYGGKSYFYYKVSRTMYSSVFIYYAQKSFDDFYKLLKTFLTLT